LRWTVKKTILLTLVLVSTALFAAGYKLYTGKVIFWDSTSPNPTDEATAIVQIDSKTKGFLLPRLSTAQKDTLGLVPPATGLMVYDETKNKVFFWNGNKWSASGGGVGGGFEYLALAEINADDIQDAQLTQFATGNAATYPTIGGAPTLNGALTRPITPSTDFYDSVENTAVYKYAAVAGQNETNDFVLSLPTTYPTAYAQPGHLARVRLWYYTNAPDGAFTFQLYCDAGPTLQPEPFGNRQSINTDVGPDDLRSGEGTIHTSDWVVDDACGNFRVGFTVNVDLADTEYILFDNFRAGILPVEGIKTIKSLANNQATLTDTGVVLPVDAIAVDMNISVYIDADEAGTPTPGVDAYELLI